MTGIALIGTGFVADYYMATLANHPGLRVAGAFDIDAARLSVFARHHGVKAYADEAACLADPDVEIVVNLTPPHCHHAVNLAALAAGKHVYCEKPLGMSFEEARSVVEAAEAAGLSVSSAPANALGQAADSVAAHLKSGAIGRPRLVYAEMEDGPVFRQTWRDWRSASGAPWPGLHEFEIGCTLEHAGYALSWLLRLFGPVRHLTAHAHVAFADKDRRLARDRVAADFSVAVLSFDDGVTARLTTGLGAPRDRSFTIVGEDGTLVADDLWDDASALHLSRFDEKRPIVARALGRFERMSGVTLPVAARSGRRLAHAARPAKKVLPAYPSRIDFAAGIAAQARAIEGGAPALFSGQAALHMSEVTLAIAAGERDYVPRSGF